MRLDRREPARPVTDVMFASTPRFDGNKCKVHLKMLTNRFKLLESKKMNLNKQKQRAVAQLLREGKSESARIQVEHIIREDYTIEVYEILRQHVDLLLARFAVVQTEPEPRKEIQESVCTIIYAGWLLGSEITELRVLYEQLAIKYGKPFVDEVTTNSGLYINPRVLKKLQFDIPDKALVETYLVEIARAHRVDWQPSFPVAGETVPTPIDPSELAALRAEPAVPQVATGVVVGMVGAPAAPATATAAAPATATGAPAASTGPDELQAATAAAPGADAPAVAPGLARSAMPAPVVGVVLPTPLPPAAPVVAPPAAPVVSPKAAPRAPVLPVVAPPPPKPASVDDELMRRLAALKSRS